MTNQRNNDNDEHLRKLLRTTDPARHLAPLDAHRAERLREKIMLNPQSTPAAPRRRSAWLLGGAGTVGAAAAAAIALPLVIGTGAASVTALSAPPAGGPAAACAEVTPDALHTATLAFRGNVTRIDGDTVTLTVTERFTGETADTVEISQGSPDLLDGSLPPFTTGGSYLVAASDGIVLGCGLTGVDTPPLAQVYDQAF